MVLAIFALPLGAWAMWRKGERRKAALMLVLAGIAAANVAIWVVPGATGTAPVDAALK